MSTNLTLVGVVGYHVAMSLHKYLPGVLEGLKLRRWRQQLAPNRPAPQRFRLPP